MNRPDATSTQPAAAATSEDRPPIVIDSSPDPEPTLPTAPARRRGDADRRAGGPLVAVVIPCYNEAAAIADVIEGFAASLPDAESHPINVSGRHRHHTKRQKLVVKERDQRCVDCGSTDFLEHDHVPDFNHSKRTLVEETELRCSRCHTARHRRDGTR